MFILKMWINKQPFTSFFLVLERIPACVVVRIAAVVKNVYFTIL